MQHSARGHTINCQRLLQGDQMLHALIQEGIVFIYLQWEIHIWSVWISHSWPRALVRETLRTTRVLIYLPTTKVAR